MKTSVLITSFNSPDFLKLVLETLIFQTVLPSQVIVADDGSTNETLDVVNAIREVAPYQLVCTWQPDLEFRAARSRNLALQRVTGDHLILIDGDCLLPNDFVSMHRKLIAPSKIVAGGRILLTKDETTEILGCANPPIDPGSGRFKRLNLPLGPLRDLNRRAWKSVRTCNMGINTSALRDVEGFDESYIGWGREDSDLVVRLINSGLEIRSGRFAAPVIHLFHNEFPRYRSSANEPKFGNLLNSPRVYPVRSCLKW